MRLLKPVLEVGSMDRSVVAAHELIARLRVVGVGAALRISCFISFSIVPGFKMLIDNRLKVSLSDLQLFRGS